MSPPFRLALVALMLCGASAHAEAQSVSLDGGWDLLLDPQQRGLAVGLSDPGHERWTEALRVAVPGPLESTPQSAGYDGVVWYRRTLPAAAPASDGERLLLEFDGANVRADVWLDGRWLGRHDGADSPFSFDLSDTPPGAGSWLVVRIVDPGDEPVDGLSLGALPHAKESWYFNYGGLTGSVRLRRAPLVEALHAEVLPPPRPGDRGSLRLTLVNRTDTPRPARILASLGPHRPPDAGRAPDRPADPPAPPPELDHESSYIEGDLTSALLLAPPGRREIELPLALDPELPWWTPEQPERVELAVTLRTDRSLQRSLTLTGLRRFELTNQGFLLNGAPIRPVGVLWQPLFPAGLCTPPDPGFLRRELSAIREAGFNLVRAHLRVMPGLYALCDELGLLVQAEPTLGWITAPDVTTLPAVDQALATLADAVRGHPSVVMLGLLNELSGQLFPHTDELRDRLHALLPAHLLIDDSGSWQGEAHRVGPGAGGPLPLDDIHLYRAWPWSTGDFEHAAQLGSEHGGPVYVSEYGFGGMPSLGPALAGYDGQLWREDAREVASDLAALRAALGHSPLDQFAHSVDRVCLLGQRDQARAATLMTAALLANPRVAGLVYTQWRDVSWECGAGLVDHWGGPKPALAAMSDLLSQHPTPTPDELRAGAPPPRARQPVARGRALSLHGRVADLVAEMLLPTAPPNAGPPDTAPPDGGPPSSTLPTLTVVGRLDNPWGQDSVANTLALLADVRAGGALLWLGAPDAGRPLPTFFFGYDGLGQVADLPFDVTAANARGHFVGTHLVLAPGSPLADDLACPEPVLDERFGDVKPHFVLATGPKVETRAELLCLDGYGLPLGAAVQSVTFGKGRLILSTLRFDDASLESPTAVRLLENLLRYAAGVAAALPDREPPAPAATPDAVQVRQIARGVWRLRIAFGLAERLTVQTVNGQRPRRHPPVGLAELVSAKSDALSQLIGGRVDSSVRWLDLIESRCVPPRKDAFVRAEMELSRRFWADREGHDMITTLELGRAHSRALALMATGRDQAARELLEQTSATLPELPPERNETPSNAPDAQQRGH